MKLIKIFRIFLIVLASATAMSCSQTAQPTADQVMEKLNSGAQLESADYDTMLDYLEASCKAGEEIRNNPGSNRILGQEYPYYSRFIMALGNAPEEVQNDDRFVEIYDRILNMMDFDAAEAAE